MDIILIKENKQIGFLKYAKDKENDYVIQSIVIDQNYRAQGYAKKLFNELINKVKQENKKITPICTYAQKQFERETAIKNMLKK